MRTRIAAITSAILFCGLSVVGSQQPAEGKIDARAEQHLKAMSTYLAGLRTFSFQVEEFFDEVQDDGQKIQLSNQRQMSVARPNKLYGDYAGDTINNRFFYDGKTVTIVDREHKTYAVDKVPGTIDAMLEDLHDRLETPQPLADFLFADPYMKFTRHVKTGTYIGLHHVGKAKCHHLAFRQKYIDWQIWIDAGEQPLPRKLVITFKRQADQPQYTALIHKWDVNVKLADDMFVFQPTEDMRKIEFLHRGAEPKPIKLPAGK